MSKVYGLVFDYSDRGGEDWNINYLTSSKEKFEVYFSEETRDLRYQFLKDVFNKLNSHGGNFDVIKFEVGYSQGIFSLPSSLIEEVVDQELQNDSGEFIDDIKVNVLDEDTNQYEIEFVYVDE